MNKYIVFLSFLLCVSTAECRDIYISTTGNDEIGDGTINNPYATPYYVLHHAAGKKITNGDIVIIRGGTYNSSKEIEIRNIDGLTIKNYPNENVYLVSPCNLDYTQQSTDAQQLHPVITLGIHYSSKNITIDGIDMSGASRYTFSVMSGGTYSPSRATGVTVTNSKIHDCGTDCVKVQPGSDNFTLTNSEIYNSCRGAVNAPTAEAEKRVDRNCQGFDSVQVDNILIRGNYFHDFPYQNDAIVPKGGGRNVLIERNKIENAFGGITVGGNTGRDFMDWVDNPIGYQAFDVTVRNNIIKNTKWWGIAVVDSKDIQIYNNTMIDVGTITTGDYLFTQGLASVSDYANKGTIFTIKHMNNWKCEDEPTCLKAQIPNNVPSVNVLYVNNVGIKNNGNGPTVDAYYNAQLNLDDINDGELRIPVELGTFKADHNVYFDPNGFTDMRVRDESGWIPGADTVHTIADWRLSTAHDPEYAEVASSFQNPLVNTDGVPLTGSQLIGTGVMIAGLTDDFYGRSRGNLIDIGAVQRSAIPRRYRYLSISDN